MPGRSEKTSLINFYLEKKLGNLGRNPGAFSSPDEKQISSEFELFKKSLSEYFIYLFLEAAQQACLSIKSPSKSLHPGLEAALDFRLCILKLSIFSTHGLTYKI